jgi:hypothetical protein
MTDCKDCVKEIVGEYYMLHNDLWASIQGGKGELCIGCVETRLGRVLTADDFSDAPLNRLPLFRSSARLLNRLGAKRRSDVSPLEAHRITLEEHFSTRRPR